MYLKSIEVQGFKSFAHKLKFDFHDGITGIVGPNGSGKSNVADAVRWVLGEQRVKQLRGGNMQDVIFSGTENRKPLSYASVAITLDNADHHLPIEFEEVTVARKIYRSGESEYLINGSTCRLKDVNELFYDTGIGKEGYSIIGQGQIDKILSGKPEERRELFDEAAGIVKYKRRKNMSLKKLEDERNNLVRVNDILAELEKQMGPLEKQSVIAKDYLSKKEELKTFDINMFLLETARLKEQMDEVREKLTISQDELETANRDYESMKVQYEAAEAEVDAIDDSIETAKRQLNETNMLKQQLEGQIDVLKEQINTARMNDEHIDSRLKTIYAEIKEREDHKAELVQEQTTLQVQLDEENAKDKVAKEALIELQSQIAEMTASMEKEKNDIIELLNNRASTKVKIQRYDTMLEQIHLRKSQIAQQMVEIKTNATNQKKELLNQNQELESISQEIGGYVDRSSELDEKIAAIQKEISQQTQKLNVGQTAYHRENSRLESLKNITERYDGYGNSIRRVMEKKDTEKGLLGVVADIVKVDKAYEVAIETALGGSIQNVVTDNEDTAKRMIGYLKQNKFGRATFLPLTSINGSGGIRHPEALEEKGVIGLASTLVKVDGKYKGLADNLLGRTIVVGSIDEGIAISRKYKQSLRIVTTEGELINPGGSMTGGAFKNSSNLLSRRREIEEFEKSVQLLKKDMDQMEADMEANKEIRTSLYGELEKVKTLLQHSYVVQNTVKMNMNQMEAKQADIKRSFENIQSENEELDKQIRHIKENQESIQLELETSEDLEKELQTNISRKQVLLEEEKVKETTALGDSEKLHLALANFEQQNQFVLENIKRIEEEIQKFKDELSELDINKDNASNDITEKEEQIEAIRKRIENSKELFDEIGQEIEKQRKLREELNQKHKSFLDKREELSKHMSELDKECYRLTARSESLEENRTKQIDYMWEEYELTYNHALEIRDENLTDLSFMKKRISTLKNEIRELGSVNVNAIEDFKNLSQRYEFLKGQHDDLIEAEATLEKIIEELDNAMKKQFKEQFALISKEFDEVFKELFGGGKGTLELMDEENLLETGIKIIAQPPGKKLQNMMQLSGGEKALTAIALLFAIQNLKPSPFCLLDEIEAALDDSNVVRFAEYLHKLTANTQFIVITHRRGTMSAADRLYGITMQEKGVSALVSVDLLEDDLKK